MKMLLGSFFSPSMLKWAFAPLVLMSLSVSAFANHVFVGDFIGNLDWDRGEGTDNWVDPNNWDSSNIGIVTDTTAHDADPNNVAPVTGPVANNIVPLFTTDAWINQTGGTPETVDIDSFVEVNGLFLANDPGEDVTLNINAVGDDGLSVERFLEVASDDPGSNAVVNVIGAGTFVALDVFGQVDLGRKGTGTLSFGGTGGDSFIDGNLEMADQNAAAVANLTLSGGATVFVAGQIKSGQGETNITMTGGTLFADNSLKLGFGGGTTNLVMSGTAEIVHSMLDHIETGSGTTNITMNDTSKMSSTTDINFGDDPNGNGTVNITLNDGSEIFTITSAGKIKVGTDGHTSLTLNGSSSLFVNDATHIEVGDNAGGDGTLTINDTASINSGTLSGLELTIGERGTGRVIVNTTSGSFGIGDPTNILQAAPTIELAFAGGNGNGTLELINDGSVYVESLKIGERAQGLVEMSGNAIITNLGTLEVGHRVGYGTINMSGNSLLTVGEDVQIEKWRNDPNAPGESRLIMTDFARMEVTDHLRMSRQGTSSLIMDGDSSLFIDGQEPRNTFSAFDGADWEGSVFTMDLSGDSIFTINDNYDHTPDPNTGAIAHSAQFRLADNHHRTFQAPDPNGPGHSARDEAKAFFTMSGNAQLIVADRITLVRSGLATFDISDTASITTGKDIRLGSSFRANFVGTQTGGSLTAGDDWEMGSDIDPNSSHAIGVVLYTMTGGTIHTTDNFKVNDTATFVFKGGSITLGEPDPNDGDGRLEMSGRGRFLIGDNTNNSIAAGAVKLTSNDDEVGIKFESIDPNGYIDVQLGGLIELVGDWRAEIGQAVALNWMITSYDAATHDPGGTDYLPALIGDAVYYEYGVAYDFTAGITSIYLGEVFKLPGDFDLDGDVDGDDFLNYQLGVYHMDYPSFGLHSAQDLADWKASFGATGVVYAALSAVTAAVPEPSSLMLIAVGLLGLGRRRRRQM